MAPIPEPGADPEADVPLDDPIVTAHIERTVAPYRALLPAQELAALEETLWMMLTTHPEVAPMVDRLRRDAATQRSGTRPSESGGRAANKKGAAR